MENMIATAEIDKAGRLVIPKKMREAMHLVPGTRLTFRQEGGGLVLEPERGGQGLVMDGGTLVYDCGPRPAIDMLDQIKRLREERSQLRSSDADDRP